MTLRAYESFEALPPGHAALLERASEESFFCGRPWFETLARHGLDAGEVPRIVALENGAGPRALLVGRCRSDGGRPRVLRSLSNFYTMEYAPLFAPGANDRNAVLSDLMRALAGARRVLDDIREDLGDQFGPEFSAVLHTHIQILEDKGFVERLEREVERRGNGVVAIREVRQHYAGMFARMEDPYFRERGADVEDDGQERGHGEDGPPHVPSPPSPPTCSSMISVTYATWFTW